MTVAHKIANKARHTINAYSRTISRTLYPDRTYVENAKGLRILIYHGICLKNPFRFNTLFLTLKTFEEHLRLYKKYFSIISLDDIYQQRYDPEKFSICLTFDDGFLNNYKYTAPLLEKYRVPATFFITSITETGYNLLWNDLLSIAGKSGPQKFTFRNEEFVHSKNCQYKSVTSGRSLNELLRSKHFEEKKELIDTLNRLIPFKEIVHEDYWMQMTKDQIKEMGGSKWVTIGSHSYYHNDLTKSSAGELQQDLSKSKSFLEAIINKEVKALAFPYGSYNSKVIKAAKEAGYQQLLATDFNQSEDKNDPALRERLTINPFISPINQVYANISGNY